MQNVVKVKFLVVGSGANGISPAVLLKKRGEGDLRIITKDSDFGGAWHVNRYPGCITDVPALAYQLSYEKNYAWTASHPAAPEMAGYLRGVARKHGLYEHTDFETTFLAAKWLPTETCWEVTTSGATYHARFLILSTGFLEDINIPKLEGREAFEGRLFHSAEWPEGYTGQGDRIAVLGTSASGVQIVPELQKVAEQLYVFQRTPVHLLPLNRELYSPEDVERRQSDPAALDAKREEIIRMFEGISRASMSGDPESERAKETARMIRTHLEQHVADPELRQSLTPDYAFGCKRPTRNDLYYRAIQQPNVRFVPEGAVGLGRNTIRSASGAEFEVDTVVLATGFQWGGDVLDVITRRDGSTVAEHQNGRRRAYKSVSLSGCPNLFLVGGAGANGAVWNGYAPGEIVPEYIFMVLDYMEQNGIEALEVDEAAETAWKDAADAILSKAPIVTGGCLNYFLDRSGADMANWPGTMEDMQRELSTFDAAQYRVVDRSPTANAGLLEAEADR